MKKIIFISVVMALAAAVYGCSTGPLSRDYGYAFTTTRNGQILNPQAVNNTQPVTGLDGQAAQAVLGKYRSSFSGKSGKGQSGQQAAAPAGGQSGY